MQGPERKQTANSEHSRRDAEAHLEIKRHLERGPK